MSDKDKVSRREFVKVGAGVVVGAAVAGAAGYYGGLGAAPKGPATTVTQTQTAGATSAQNVLAGKTINIGVVEPLTGPFAAFGKSGVAGLNLAVSEINKSGGVLGATINPTIQDFGGDPAVATTATEKLITTNNATVIMGTFTSGAAIAVGAVTEKYKVPFVTIGCSADSIFQQGWKYVFGLTPRQSTFAQLVMTFLGNIVKPKSVALVSENTLMGQSGAKAETDFAAAHGWTVTNNEFYKSGDLDYKSMLLKIKAGNPDVVIFSPYLTDLVLLMRQSHEIDFNPLAFASTGGAGSQIPDFITAAGKDSEYIIGGMEYYGDKNWPEADVVHNLDAKLRAQYGVAADFQSGNAYTQVYVLKKAIEVAQSLDPTAIRNAMLGLDFVVPWFGWVKYAPTGLEFAPNSSFGSMQPVGIAQVQNGKYVTVWPDEYASGKIVYPVPAWSKR